jgi:hypothetical protein
MTIPTSSSPRTASWRRPGPLLALVAAAFLLVNVVRAVADPVAFADYLGLPLADPADTGFVLVYASRTAVLAGVTVLLVVLGRLRTLAWVSALAVVLPVTDAVLSSGAGAAPGTVARHAVIAVYLAVTAAVLARHGSDRDLAPRIG